MTAKAKSSKRRHGEYWSWRSRHGGTGDERLDDVYRQIFEVQKRWRALHLEVMKALRANGAEAERLRTDDSIGTCPAVDRAMRDCEHAGSDIDGPPDFDRAEVLCRVTTFMIEREWPKFNSDPKTWLMRHWSELLPEPKAEPPRRWIGCDEA